MRHWPDADTRSLGARAGRSPASPDLSGSWRFPPWSWVPSALAACAADAAPRASGRCSRPFRRRRPAPPTVAGTVAPRARAPISGVRPEPRQVVPRLPPLRLGARRVPTVTRTPAPPPVRTTDAAMTGDLPGWKQVFVEDFSAGDVPLGLLPRARFTARGGAPATRTGPRIRPGRSTAEDPATTRRRCLSVRNGIAGLVLHSENGVSMGAAPTPKIPNASPTRPRANSSSTAGTRPYRATRPASRRRGSCGRTVASGPGTGRWISPKGDLAKTI